MFIDVREIDCDRIIETDLCIIGAGAAGITLALEFAQQRFQVCLLEAGGLEPDRQTQRLQKALNIGRRYHGLRFSRPRHFGGATNVWGGHCVPLRAINFECVPWIPYSGWPFGLDELDIYYSRAHQRLNLGEVEYDVDKVSTELGMPLFPFDRDKVETVMSRYLALSRIEALSFGIRYGEQIELAPNITTYLAANVTSINQPPEAGYIKDVSVRTLMGKRFSVRAGYYVLAAGGIENARLLLLSNDVQQHGLGNENDLVGRFFMDHISYYCGSIVPAAEHRIMEIYGAIHKYCGGGVRCHLALPEHIVRNYQIPDFRAEIFINKPLKLEKLLAVANAVRDRIKDVEVLDSCVIGVLKTLRKLGGRLDRQIATKGPVVYRLANYVEQVPNPDSRIRLSDNRDALGLQRVTVDWRLSSIDKEGIRVAHRLIADEVKRSGFGHMHTELPDDDEEQILHGANGGGHHLGTTRMHVSPRSGVVDPNCRIHGLENMYITGSSVFPTGGYANPTLTIVALAIRLADHLTPISTEGNLLTFRYGITWVMLGNSEIFH